MLLVVGKDFLFQADMALKRIHLLAVMAERNGAEPSDIDMESKQNPGYLATCEVGSESRSRFTVRRARAGCHSGSRKCYRRPSSMCFDDYYNRDGRAITIVAITFSTARHGAGSWREFRAVQQPPKRPHPMRHDPTCLTGSLDLPEHFTRGRTIRPALGLVATEDLTATLSDRCDRISCPFCIHAKWIHCWELASWAVDVDRSDRWENEAPPSIPPFGPSISTQSQ